MSFNGITSVNSRDKHADRILYGISLPSYVYVGSERRKSSRISDCSNVSISYTETSDIRFRFGVEPLVVRIIEQKNNIAILGFEHTGERFLFFGRMQHVHTFLFFGNGDTPFMAEPPVEKRRLWRCPPPCGQVVSHYGNSFG